MTNTKTASATCAGHHQLPPADRDACSRATPTGHQQQAAFLLQQLSGNLNALAAWLDVKPRTRQRILNGRRLSRFGRLRRRLRDGALPYGRPLEAALRAEEARRQAERDARGGQAPTAPGRGPVAVLEAARRRPFWLSRRVSRSTPNGP